MEDSSDDISLDRIDRKILHRLQRDGRLSNADLAKATSTSAATCHRRTQRLFDNGVIRSVRAEIAPEKVGRGTLVMVGVVLDRSTRESFAIFEAAIAKLRDEGSRRQPAAGFLKSARLIGYGVLQLFILARLSLWIAEAGVVPGLWVFSFGAAALAAAPARLIAHGDTGNISVLGPALFALLT
jgi:DNA-binding Lrp family transcriptional regulator